MASTTRKILLSLAVMTSIASSSYAQNNEETVNAIMKLRAEVEALYTQIDENKEHYKAQMKSYAVQSADNKAQINRKTTDIKLANLELEKIKVKIASTLSESADLTPLIESGSETIKQSINEGIPFKVSERVAAVDEIAFKLEENLITQEKALQLLWASFDDNLRLTKEIGLFKQQVEVEGKSVMAKVGKIGSVMMFFQLPDERVGKVVKKSDGYHYQVVTDEEKAEQINMLFDALQKQIRTGYFTIPNALVLMENK